MKIPWWGWCVGFIAVMCAFGAVSNQGREPLAAPVAKAVRVAKPVHVTPTPVAKAVPAPKPDDPEAMTAYRSQITDVSGTFADALTTIGQCTSECSTQPDLIYDTAWKERLVLALATLTVMPKSVQAVHPVPAPCKQAHALLLRAAKEASRSAYTLAGGLDALNAREIRHASDEMEQVNADVRSATDAYRLAFAGIP